MEKIEIIGNLGQDAKLLSSNGKELISFSVGCNRRITDSKGEVKEITNWYSVLMQKNGVLDYLKTGTKVFVEGNFSVNTYKDKDNQWRSGLNINATRVELLSVKKEV